MNDITAKQVPFGQYEFVDVEFEVNDQDVVVPYERLRVENKDDVRWLDVTKGGRQDGLIPHVYRLYDSPQKRFGANYVVLRCTVAGYKTRLMLFVERS